MKRVTDLEKFALEEVWRPYQNMMGYEKRLESLPVDLEETARMLTADDRGWSKRVLDRIATIGFTFPDYIRHPLVDVIRALRPEPSAAGALSPATEVLRDFWLHYDHQTGRWCVEEQPPKVIRTGAEVIHTREVSTDAILALPCADEAAIRADEREKCAVQDQIIGQIEERFPNWRSFRDLIDCIDVTLHNLRSVYPS